MVIKELTQIGNPLLKQVTLEVSPNEIDSDKIRSVIQDLADSLRHHELIGMAASQIGQPYRIFVTEVRETAYRKPDQLDPLTVYINPRITAQSADSVEIYEGCGSVAHSKIFGPVVRPAEVTVEALDQNGTKFERHVTGLVARVIQHEMDHCDGIEFIERVTENARLMTDTEYQERILKR